MFIEERFHICAYLISTGGVERREDVCDSELLLLVDFQMLHEPRTFVE